MYRHNNRNSVKNIKTSFIAYKQVLTKVSLTGFVSRNSLFDSHMTGTKQDDVENRHLSVDSIIQSLRLQHRKISKNSIYVFISTQGNFCVAKRVNSFFKCPAMKSMRVNVFGNKT